MLNFASFHWRPAIAAHYVSYRFPIVSIYGHTSWISSFLFIFIFSLFPQSSIDFCCVSNVLMISKFTYIPLPFLSHLRHCQVLCDDWGELPYIFVIILSLTYYLVYLWLLGMYIITRRCHFPCDDWVYLWLLVPHILLILSGSTFSW